MPPRGCVARRRRGEAVTTRDPLAAALADLGRAIREQTSCPSPTPAPSWSWVRCGSATISTKQAHALAKRGELRITKIGKYVYAHRDDLDRLAERGRVRTDAAPIPANADDDLAGVDPGILAAFARAAGSK